MEPYPMELVFVDNEVVLTATADEIALLSESDTATLDKLSKLIQSKKLPDNLAVALQKAMVGYSVGYCKTGILELKRKF
jgi:hypothetical protein